MKHRVLQVASALAMAGAALAAPAAQACDRVETAQSDSQRVARKIAMARETVEVDDTFARRAMSV